MRLSSIPAAAFAVGFSVMGVAHAFDPGTMSPGQAFRTGYAAYKNGDTGEALQALNYAASKGHAGALWKLGQMYATGDGVQKDDAKALQMFSQVADDYADGNPHGRDAPFVADAFVALGTYYQHGIPGSVSADVSRARRCFLYAASYFGDPEAQYQLASMYLSGIGGEQSPRQAARWYKLAAEKGHPGAQAQLGSLLFQGIGVERNPIKGLMWLSIARLSGRGDPSIQSRHEEAFSASDETERRTALALAEDWMAHNPGSALPSAPAGVTAAGVTAASNLDQAPSGKSSAGAVAASAAAAPAPGSGAGLSGGASGMTGSVGGKAN